MSSSFGNQIKITIFGQSHGDAIGVVVDGLPAGEDVNVEAVDRFLRRRAPGGKLATPRKEADSPRFLSGLVDGKTCGAPLCAVIENTDARSRDYSGVYALPRPSHADYPELMRNGPASDLRGGGHHSGRLTAPLCIAGAVCMQILARRGITVGGHIAAIGSTDDRLFDPVSVTLGEALSAGKKEIPVLDDRAGERMQAEIARARAEGDSVGGIVECCVLGLPPGVGGPIFEGIENRISAAVFGIPGVRGIAFGAGFEAAGMWGSEHNDPYVWENGHVRTRTNRHGGVLGGLSTGMPLIFTAAFKPTASISKPQQTVNLETGEAARLRIEGRHDPCIVPRALPCVEAAAALAVADLLAVHTDLLRRN